MFEFLALLWSLGKARKDITSNNSHGFSVFQEWIGWIGTAWLVPPNNNSKKLEYNVLKRWSDVLTFPSLPVLCLNIIMPHPVKSYGSWLQKSRRFKLNMNFKVFGLPSSPYSISRKTDAQRKFKLFRHNFLNSRTSDLMIGDLFD